MKRLICWLRGHDDFTATFHYGPPAFYPCQRCGAANSVGRHLDRLARKRERYLRRQP